jgi:hypothetical protein
MHYPLLPWVRDRCEVQLDIYLAQRRVSSSHNTYLKTYFKSVVSDIINEGNMKNAKSSKTTNQPPLVWANTNLTPEHIDAFTGQERTDSEILNGVLALVGEGCELVLKHDSSSQCWRAYLFNKAPDLLVHHGLSCFADSPRNTVDLLLFKFFIVLGGEFPETTPETAKPKFG